ncbi:MmpS family transport accessory protein [Gordonia sp. ABSL1-1]|uniref:MmpS family transport accessory protein n=1 Tax=Gordonia sp. ABSL1-1 TaxID=3053923 RepID=UPI0025735041|nr:MmpS family transport accessory protein [Gordonia sp. ABSL1-1]MDL9938431.1 MmpS family transport accessory protein [Gordonia sp. ABSL1-1]
MTDPQNPEPQQYPAQPYPGQPYPVLPKKKRVWPWVLGGITLVFLLVMGGCVALIGGAANEIDKESKREVTVVYRVTGNGANASITFTDKDFNIAQETNAKLPWEKTVVITGLGKTASLTVTNDENDNAKSTCEILVDGQVRFTQTAAGPYASATCSGDVG